MDRVTNAKFSLPSVASGELVGVTVTYEATAAVPIAIRSPSLTIHPPQLMADPTRSSITAQVRLTLVHADEAGEGFLVRFELDGPPQRTMITVTARPPAARPTRRRPVEEPA